MDAVRYVFADASRKWKSLGDYQSLPTANGTPEFSDKDIPTSALSFVPRRLMRLSTKGIMLIVGSIIAFFLLATTATTGAHHFLSTPPKTIRETVFADSQQLAAGDRCFVVVVPVDSPGPDLCKVVTSAIALGYPSPIVVNWGKDFQKSGNWFGGSHLGKITGTLEYLDAVASDKAHEGERLRPDDLILVVDAYDIWFQLPPEILLRRYHESNRKANERLAKQWGGMSDIPMKQSIIISTQKKCFPAREAGSNLHCDALPQSPLRSDLYGANTDMDPAVNPNEFHDIRPRFVNSGSVMGPVGDMRRYLRRVKYKMDEGLANGVHLFSDQGIFGEVLGEQEIWRNWRRRTREGLPNNEGTAMVQQDLEYHVGLDYYQDLFVPTVFEEDDGQFINLNNQTAIDKYSKDLGIWPIRLRGVPNDVQDACNPLKDVVKESENLSWGEMALYADFFTTAVPVVVHHNAHKDGRKERRTTWWDRTWYFPYLRDLLTFHLTAGERVPLANLPAEGGDLVYWAARADETKRKVRQFAADKAKDGFNELEFKDICRFEDETDDSDKHWYTEVFRDDKGPI